MYHGCLQPTAKGGAALEQYTSAWAAHGGRVKSCTLWHRSRAMHVAIMAKDGGLNMSRCNRAVRVQPVYMAASASGNNDAGLRNQVCLIGVYGQLVGLCFPL
jgi:hypothetical protein